MKWISYRQDYEQSEPQKWNERNDNVTTEKKQTNKQKTDTYMHGTFIVWLLMDKRTFVFDTSEMQKSTCTNEFQSV